MWSVLLTADPLSELSGEMILLLSKLYTRQYHPNVYNLWRCVAY